MFVLYAAGQKRPLDEDNNGAAEGGDGADRQLKKARGEGPHVELRVLLQSKVNNVPLWVRLCNLPILFSLFFWVQRSYILKSVCLQNAGAIIGKGGANIKRLRSDVSTKSLSNHCLPTNLVYSPPMVAPSISKSLLGAQYENKNQIWPHLVDLFSNGLSFFCLC